MTAVFCGFLVGISGGRVTPATSLGGNLPASNHPRMVSLRPHPARPRPADIASETSATRAQARIDPPFSPGLFDHTKVSTSFMAPDSASHRLLLPTLNLEPDQRPEPGPLAC